MRRASTAVRYASWYEKTWGRPSTVPMVPVGESGNGQAVMVELLIDGVWTDLSSLGLVISGDQVQISQRGRSSENSVSGPATCNFTAKNFDAAFSLTNPASPYWGKIVLGTQMRVSVPRGIGVSRRFWGALSSIPQESDISGRYSTVSFEAAGKLRPLGQGEAPLHSALYREKTRGQPPGSVGHTVTLAAYWPMEDGAGALSLASASQGSPMRFTGSPALSAYDGFVCSDTIPNINGSVFSGAVPSFASPSGTSNTAQILTFMMSAPSGITAGTVIARVTVNATLISLIELSYPSTDHLQIKGYDRDGTGVYDSGSIAVPVAGDLLAVELMLETVRNAPGANGLWISLNTQATTSANSQNYVFDYTAIPYSGNVSAVTVNPGKATSDVYIGHVSVHNVVFSLGTFVFDWGSINGYSGELADVRFDRLCTEEGITHEVVGTYGQVRGDQLTAASANPVTAEGVAMGPQLVDTLLTLLRQCEASDDGIIYEMTSDYGIGYRTRRDLQNQSALLTLDHSAHELSSPLTPLVDDSFVLNDVTVTRTGGSSYEAIQTTGRRSVNPAPAGMGPYPTAYEQCLQYDDQAGSAATWAVHKGAVDEARYTSVQVNLNSLELAGTVKRNTILDLLCGDRMVISGLPTSPARYGYEDISQLALGFTESIDQFQHVITINCMPESPFRTGVVGTDTVNTGGSHLVGSVNTTDTSLTVATDGSYVWADSATYASDFPFDIMVNGERMTVTAITGTSSPQTFTVTRSVNTVSKPHNDQSVITLYAPKAVGL